MSLPLRLILLLAVTLQFTASQAELCPQYLGRLYAKGLREYWTGKEKDFAETVFGPLVDRGFDHESITQLESAILNNFVSHPPSGDAKSLGRVLSISERNAQMLLSFYDLTETVGPRTATGYEAYTQALSHVRARTLAPVRLYLLQNQTKKDITALTQDLRRLLKSPALSESQVYELMWLTNLEMGKAWEKEISPELLRRLGEKLNRADLPTELGELALELYRKHRWSNAEIALELGVSPVSLAHHFHATGVEPTSRLGLSRRNNSYEATTAVCR